MARVQGIIRLVMSFTDTGQTLVSGSVDLWLQSSAVKHITSIISDQTLSSLKMSSDIKDVLASIDPLPASFSSCFANLCTRDMRHTLYALYSLQETDERDGR